VAFFDEVHPKGWQVKEYGRLLFLPNSPSMSTFTPEAFKTELIRILDYWQKFAPDQQLGGFYGRVSYQNQGDGSAARSVVLTGRILWTFSLAHRLFQSADYLTLADRAYQQLTRQFFDPGYGGVYWSVNPRGAPFEVKKQIYGNAFAMYGLAEYYRVTNYPPALERAIELFNLIEEHAFDPINNGYREALSRDWTATDDYILSKAPYTKSMNTHLHLVEAYTNLFSVWPDRRLKTQTVLLLDTILDRIVNPQTDTLQLFFEDNWTAKDHIVSYGHDIEASWLLYETAEILSDPALLKKTKEKVVRMASAATKGLSTDGALNYEHNPATGHTQTDRSWWVGAEQTVGFYNAFQLTGDPQYRTLAERSWAYVTEKFVDITQGEWYGTVKEDGTPVRGDKISFWKCPYHNARACAEMWKRTDLEIKH
jgi:cellobiose epimerase